MRNLFDRLAVRGRLSALLGVLVLCWSVCPAQQPALPEVITPDNAEEVPIEGAGAGNVEEVGGAPTDETAQRLPTTSPESPKLTLVRADQPIEAILGEIRTATGVVVNARGKTAGTKLTLREVDKTVEEILDTITKPNNWKWVKRADGSYDLYDQETYVAEVVAQRVQRKVFTLVHIDAVELNKVIEPVLTPEVGASSPDERTNSLIVTDLPGTLSMIESIIAEYDIQLYTHVFEIVNADTEEIADRLDQLKSKYAEIHVDPPNHMIIVKDETLEKIRIMEQLVELLDRDQEIRIYHLNNIGPDGQEAEDLIQAFIEPIVTQDAILEFNRTTSLLYVKDVRPVHKKILDILMQVDRPRKQVLLEGELLSVALSTDLSIGMNWQFGDSLLDAINTSKVEAPTGVNPGDTMETQLAGFPHGAVGSSGLAVIDMTNSVRASLNAALTDSRTRLLLKPRLILANHEEGEINVERREPILNTFFSDNVNQGSFRTSGQTFVNTGLSMRLTPRISNRGLVELEVFFKNSVPIIVPDIGGGQRGVGESSEEANTILIIPTGQTRVIGGLISRDFTDGVSGVPFFSQIPYLGFLFGNKTKKDTLRNLMFFVTPTIVGELPQNDIIVEAVNAPARASLMEEQGAVLPPEEINDIPEELKPYLEQIRPEALLYEGDDTMTTGSETLETSVVPGMTMEDLEAAAKALLSTAPVPAMPADGDDVLKTGGAGGETRPGLAGPSGTFGGPARQPGRVRPTTPGGQPTPAPQPTPVPVQPVATPAPGQAAPPEDQAPPVEQPPNETQI
jgi:type II secretory pathway component GspD/PulD (secretin)